MFPSRVAVTCTGSSMYAVVGHRHETPGSGDDHGGDPQIELQKPPLRRVREAFTGSALFARWGRGGRGGEGMAWSGWAGRFPTFKRNGQAGKMIRRGRVK